MQIISSLLTFIVEDQSPSSLLNFYHEDQPSKKGWCFFLFLCFVCKISQNSNSLSISSLNSFVHDSCFTHRYLIFCFYPHVDCLEGAKLFSNWVCLEGNIWILEEKLWILLVTWIKSMINYNRAEFPIPLVVHILYLSELLSRKKLICRNDFGKEWKWSISRSQWTDHTKVGERLSHWYCTFFHLFTEPNKHENDHSMHYSHLFQTCGVTWGMQQFGYHLEICS